jgi:hypothetical protein
LDNWNSDFQITKIFNLGQQIDLAVGGSPGSNDSNAMPDQRAAIRSMLLKP